MKKILTILMMLGLIMFISGGSGAEDNKPDIKELTQELGADDWQTRESAQQQLTQLGESLIKDYRKLVSEDKVKELESIKSEIETLAKALAENAQSKDPEIKMRINYIRQHFYISTIPKIAFVSNRDGNKEIYVMGTDGKNQTRLTQNQTDDTSPDWSPDGKRIAFRSSRDGDYEIYIMDVDGKNQIRLTQNQARDQNPAWSPDGKRIVFASRQNDGNLGIYVMDMDGKNQTRLTQNKADDQNPAWSPDGKRIAFDSDRDGNKQIYVMDVDGKNQIRLTHNKANDQNPAWNPDGKKITFDSTRDGNEQIYVMDADGKNQTNLTQNKSNDGMPAWSPSALLEISALFFPEAKDK